MCKRRDAGREVSRAAFRLVSVHDVARLVCLAHGVRALDDASERATVGAALARVVSQVFG